MTSAKPRVQPDDLDLAFYSATAAAGRLCLQQCEDCGQWTHPARYYCPRCASEKFSFRPVSGRARIHSYTVSHFSVETAWKDRVPYVTIVAETEEGPRLLARTELTADQITLDLPVALRVEVIDPEFSYVWADRDQEGMA
jgi:uncharacterized OB-fold protein